MRKNEDMKQYFSCCSLNDFAAKLIPLYLRYEAVIFFIIRSFDEQQNDLHFFLNFMVLSREKCITAGRWYTRDETQGQTCFFINLSPPFPIEDYRLQGLFLINKAQVCCYSVFLWIMPVMQKVWREKWDTAEDRQVSTSLYMILYEERANIILRCTERH